VNGSVYKGKKYQFVMLHKRMQLSQCVKLNMESKVLEEPLASDDWK